MPTRDDDLVLECRNAFLELLVHAAEIERVREDDPANERNAYLAELFPKLRAAAGKFVPLYDALINKKLDRKLN